MAVDPIQSGLDVEKLALDNPDEYERLLRGYHLLAGSPRETEDLRISAVPQTRHLDRRRYSLGLRSLTDLGGPMRAQDLFVIGAVTGHGKTAFAERIAIGNARDHKVLFASLELPREQVRDRILSKIMRCDVDTMLAARAEDSEEYIDATRTLEDEMAGLYIWRPKMKDRSIQAITQQALDMSAALLIIDYARKIKGWKAGQEGADVVDYLWEWITYTGIPTVLLTQIKRPDGVAQKRRPTIREFSGTSALEEAATKAMVLWRPYAGLPKMDYVAEMIMGKNRAGPMFTMHAHWSGPNTDFFDMTPHENDNARCCVKRSQKGTDQE